MAVAAVGGNAMIEAVYDANFRKLRRDTPRSASISPRVCDVFRAGV
jgi:hypothetical protein